MFIFKSTYKRLREALEHREKSICDQHKLIMRQEEALKNKDMQIADLRDSVRNAKDLKAILENLYPLHTVFGAAFSVGSNGVSINLPDDVARVVPDHFGGSVLKHEATKVVVLDKNGSARVGFTAKKADKGFSYLLVREK